MAAGDPLCRETGEGERDELKSDPRSRRRRTIDPNQLSLLEQGEIGYAYAYSFILTNLDWEVTEIEIWLRKRALVEERIKDSRAVRHETLRRYSNARTPGSPRLTRSVSRGMVNGSAVYGPQRPMPGQP